MLAVIPFSGFYESWHADELDSALEQMLSDDYGNCNHGLNERVYFSAEWQKIHAAYAAAYAENFADHFKIKLKFESLNSPREYNFTTDRIFVELETEEVERVFEEVSAIALDAVCERMFTSYDGFSSHYSPDWRSWGPPEEWDHNQVFALITAYVEQEHGGNFEQSDEIDLMESDRCNGAYDDWIYTHAGKEGRRALDVALYLRQRSERKYRIAAKETA